MDGLPRTLPSPLSLLCSCLLLAQMFFIGACGQMESLEESFSDQDGGNPQTMNLGEVLEVHFDGELEHRYHFTSLVRQDVRVYISATLYTNWEATKYSYDGPLYNPPGRCLTHGGWGECDVPMDEEETMYLRVNNPERESGVYVLLAYEP